MDTRKVTLVATIAVIALVAIGIGYAYTAATTNSGNDVSPEYLKITLSDPSNPAYSDAFTDDLGYDTVTTYEDTSIPADEIPDHEYVTYTLDKTQLSDHAGKNVNGEAVNFKAKQVGSTLYINIDETAGIAADENSRFFVNVSNISGQMSNQYTYKIGYKFGGDTETLSNTEYFIDYTVGSDVVNNILAPSDGSTVYCDTQNHTFKVATKMIAVNLYVLAMPNAQKFPIEDMSSLVKPMVDVTFKFTASTGTPPAINGHTLTVNAVGATVAWPNGILPSQTFYTGDSVTLTVTPGVGLTQKVLAVNGVDAELVEGKLTVSFTGSNADKDIVVDIVFEEQFEITAGTLSGTTLVIATSPAFIGDDVTLTFTPTTPGYVPYSIVVNYTDVTTKTITPIATAENIYTFKAVGFNMTVDATYVDPDGYAVTFSKSVEGATLTATVDDSAINTGDLVPYGKTIKFTYVSSAVDKAPVGENWNLVPGVGSHTYVKNVVNTGSVTVTVTSEQNAS